MLADNENLPVAAVLRTPAIITRVMWVQTNSLEDIAKPSLFPLRKALEIFERRLLHPERVLTRHASTIFKQPMLHLVE